MVIETERLLLRLPEDGDVSWLAEAIADPEVLRFIGLGETRSSVDAAAQVESMQRCWQEDGFGRFVVLRKADRAPLGRVGLLAWDPLVWRNGTRAEIGADAELELGWTLARAAWGKGYATEAAAAVRDWARREVRPRRLISLIHPGNERSMRVATKIGERFERPVTTEQGVEVQLWTLPNESGP